MVLTSSLQRGEVLAQPFMSYLACARYYIPSEIRLQLSSEEKSAYGKNWFWEFRKHNTSQHDALHKVNEW